MNKETEYINNSGIQNDFNKILDNAEIFYDKSKDDVWKDISSKIDNNKPVSRRSVNINLYFLRAAAIITGIIGLSLFFTFYSKTFDCPRGQHLSVVLPDSSTVELNAESTLKFFPLKWYFSRQIIFEGEGLFNVKKGKKFMVSSPLGTTEVLGTRFNIYARPENYRVTCISGSVKIISNTNKNVILNPDQQAKVDIKGNINHLKNYTSETSTDWINYKFNFISCPVKLIFEEIERQYNVSINLEYRTNPIHTGFFDKEDTVEEALDLVCKPLLLTFVKVKNGEYTIQNKK